MGAIGFNFLAGGGIDATAGGEAFSDRFGEIQFPRGEEVAQQADILRGIMEPLSDDMGGKTFDEGGSQGFITSLPIGDGMSKEGCVLHGKYYII